jgi:hypothetical protein
MEIGASAVEQADDGRVDVPHLVGASRAKTCSPQRFGPRKFLLISESFGRLTDSLIGPRPRVLSRGMSRPADHRVVRTVVKVLADLGRFGSLMLR